MRVLQPRTIPGMPGTVTPNEFIAGRPGPTNRSWAPQKIPGVPTQNWGAFAGMGGGGARGMEGGEGGGEVDVAEVEREAEGEPLADDQAVDGGPGVDAGAGQLEGRVLRGEGVGRIEDVAVDAAGIGVEPDPGLLG